MMICNPNAGMGLFTPMQLYTNIYDIMQYRIDLMQQMQRNPVALFNPVNWMEMNGMYIEKYIAFSQASIILMRGLAPLATISLDVWKWYKPLTDMIMLPQKTFAPIEKKVTANARRIKKLQRQRH